MLIDICEACLLSRCEKGVGALSQALMPPALETSENWCSDISFFKFSSHLDSEEHLESCDCFLDTNARPDCGKKILPN